MHDQLDNPILECSLPLRATLLYENGLAVNQASRALGWGGISLSFSLSPSLPLYLSRVCISCVCLGGRHPTSVHPPHRIPPHHTTHHIISHFPTLSQPIGCSLFMLRLFRPMQASSSEPLLVGETEVVALQVSTYCRAPTTRHTTSNHTAPPPLLHTTPPDDHRERRRLSYA